MKAASLTLFATLFSTTASAHTGSARLVIDNDVNGTVQVFVDSRSFGTILPNGEATFSIDAGWHRVEVRRNGTVLLSEWTELGRRDADFFRVRPMTGTVFVTNSGHRPLFLDGEGRANDAWILGGDTQRLTLEPGSHTFRASIWTTHGLHVQDTQTVFVSPNDERRFSFSVDPILPAHGTVWVRNSEAHEVLVYADGRYLGSIGAFDTRSFHVDAGSVRLVARTRGANHDLFEQHLQLARGGDARVIVHDTARPTSVRYVW